MKLLEALQLFHSGNSMVSTELDRVEMDFDVDLDRNRGAESHVADANYAQFQMAIRAEAASMARHYELFYCLENSIRDMVSSMLLASVGEDWWDDFVPQSVKDNARANLQREQDAGVTLRSGDSIDYTTFGELQEIIKSNWDVFGDTFNSRSGVARVLSGLNLLRGPIAHCAPLAEDEVTRLELALRDWFRLME